jgi:hypothetical protein
MTDRQRPGGQTEGGLDDHWPGNALGRKGQLDRRASRRIPRLPAVADGQKNRPQTDRQTDGQTDH